MLPSAVSLTRAWRSRGSPRRYRRRSPAPRNQRLPLRQDAELERANPARNTRIALPLSVVSFARAPAIGSLIPSGPATTKQTTHPRRTPMMHGSPGSSGRPQSREESLAPTRTRRLTCLRPCVGIPHRQAPDLSSSTALAPDAKIRADDIRGGKIGQRKAVSQARARDLASPRRDYLIQENPHDNSRARRYCHSRSGRCVVGP